jgi:hypothetical protein
MRMCIIGVPFRNVSAAEMQECLADEVSVRHSLGYESVPDGTGSGPVTLLGVTHDVA